MAQEKHPLDAAIERLEALADKPVAAQEASPDYWELNFAADESVGDFPQAVLPETFQWGETEAIGADGFPAVAVPEQELQPAAHWTDVLSSNFPPRDNPSAFSEGYLLNDKALAVFKQCNLGEFREYPAIVRDQTGAARSLTYLHIGNVIPPTAIDFERSQFYLADMLGLPKGPVAVNSFEEWLEKQRQAREGELDGCEEFSKIQYKKLFFRSGHTPSVELFRLARLGISVYISARLKDAIVNSGITGLEIKPNKRLFAA